MLNEKEMNEAGNHTVSDLAAADYRAAILFSRYGINYCCGGRWPLQVACEAQGIDMLHIIEELSVARQALTIPSSTLVAEWDTDFLLQFIDQVCYHYFDGTIPVITLTRDFVEKHEKQYPNLQPLPGILADWHAAIAAIKSTDESVLFPYIRQLTHARAEKAPYAAILIRTLRKPFHEQQAAVNKQLQQTMRLLLDEYEIPAKACTSYKVVVAALAELDRQLEQYHYLRNKILYNHVLQLEKELLNHS